jgi:hypothetical protein
MTAIMRHYIEGAFVESDGWEVRGNINPSSLKVIARVALGDEQDARGCHRRRQARIRQFRPSQKEERAMIFRRPLSDQWLCLRVDPQAPWGGFEHSGVDREFRTFGIEASLEPRAIPE